MTCAEEDHCLTHRLKVWWNILLFKILRTCKYLRNEYKKMHQTTSYDLPMWLKHVLCIFNFAVTFKVSYYLWYGNIDLTLYKMWKYNFSFFPQNSEKRKVLHSVKCQYFIGRLSIIHVLHDNDKLDGEHGFKTCTSNMCQHN